MLKNRDLISITDLTKTEIEEVLERAADYDNNTIKRTALTGKVIGSLFFEPSTRTRLSFEAAVYKLSGQVIGFAGTESTSMNKKGESFTDTIRMVAGFADAIIIRHPEPGSAAQAAAVADVPVINAGDGANEHPTQTLLDLYSIQKTQGTLDDLTIGLVGDLKYGRVPHSLAKALAHWPSTRQVWVAPESLHMPNDVKEYVQEKGVQVTETSNLAEALPEFDITLMTRVQVERFSDPADYEKVKDVYVLTHELLAPAKSNMKIIHPLPRRYEIPETIDTSPHAYYFQQAKHGVPVRMALLSLICAS